MHDSGSDGPFFDTVGPWVQKFAAEHNLLLETWQQDIGIWALYFEHPNGGVGRIDIRSGPARRARVGSCWCVEEGRELRVAHGRELLLRPEQPEFSEGLSQALRSMLAWDASQLHEASDLPPEVQRAIEDADWYEPGSKVLPEPRL